MPLRPSSWEPRFSSLRNGTHTSHRIIMSMCAHQFSRIISGTKEMLSNSGVCLPCGAWDVGASPSPPPRSLPQIFLPLPVPRLRRMTAVNVINATVTCYVGTRPFKTESQAHVEAGREICLRMFTLPRIWGCTRPAVPEPEVVLPPTLLPPTPGFTPVDGSHCGGSQEGSPSRDKVRKSEDLYGESNKENRKQRGQAGRTEMKR